VSVLSLVADGSARRERSERRGGPAEPLPEPHQAATDKSDAREEQSRGLGRGDRRATSDVLAAWPAEAGPASWPAKATVVPLVVSAKFAIVAFVPRPVIRISAVVTRFEPVPESDTVNLPNGPSEFLFCFRLTAQPCLSWIWDVVSAITELKPKLWSPKLLRGPNRVDPQAVS
jgi:hypothetical protein